MVVGAAVGIIFIRRQYQLTDPLLDLQIFANRAFSIALLSLLVYSMSSGTTMVFVTQCLQLVEGLSPFWASLGMVPGMVASIVSFQLAPLLARRIRPAYLIGGGLIITATGLLLITQASVTSGPAILVVGFLLSALGSGPVVTLGTNLVVGSAPVEKAGSAAAIAQTGNEFGYALGIGTLGSIGTAVYRAQIASALPSGISRASASSARDTLAGAVSVAQYLPKHLAVVLLTSAREAFTSGLHAIAAISVILLVGVALLVVTILRQVRPGEEVQPEPSNEVDTATIAVQESRQR